MSDVTSDPTSGPASDPASDPAARPAATPPVVDRDAFEAALAEQLVREKELTRHGDRVSAARRRLPMVEVDDYVFAGPDGPVRLTDLFGPHDLLVVQNFMFGPDWEEGCPSCTWATDNLPQRMDRLTDEGIAFAMVSQAPVDKLEAWRQQRGWDVWWVSSQDTTYHHDWGWTLVDEQGQEGPVPGYSCYLLDDGRPYLTWRTTGRGTEPVHPVVNLQDRTVYGRQQEWEDSPEGWPQFPTYG